MSEEKKDKPQVDVRDLKPTKDAKGGTTGFANVFTDSDAQYKLNLLITRVS